MSGKVKLLTSLCATMIMMVVAISSIFAATSASLGITCTVSYTATNFVGNIKGQVEGLTTLQNNYTSGNDMDETLPFITPSGPDAPPSPAWQIGTSDSPAQIIVDEVNGIPSDIVYTFIITNGLTVGGTITPVAQCDSTFDLTSSKYATYSITSELTLANYATIKNSLTFNNINDLPSFTIPAKNQYIENDYTYHVLILEYTFKVKEPSRSFGIGESISSLPVQNINIDISLSRVMS